MKETKNNALKVNLKFISMGKHVQMLMGGLDKMQQQMDAETQTSKIQMDMNFHLVQPNMKFINVGKWQVST
jgi:hypothetical protein